MHLFYRHATSTQVSLDASDTAVLCDFAKVMLTMATKTQMSLGTLDPLTLGCQKKAYVPGAIVALTAGGTEALAEAQI